MATHTRLHNEFMQVFLKHVFSHFELCACVCHEHAGARGSWRVSGLLKLQPQVVVSLLVWVLGTKCRSAAKPIYPLNFWASLQPT